MMLLSRFKVQGHSMEPTLKDGQTLLASSLQYFFTTPKVKDIVVFNNKGKTFIKRVKEKEGTQYFLTGDNQRDSLDSRKMGWVKRNAIIGKVIANF